MSDQWEDAEDWEDEPSNAERAGLIQHTPKYKDKSTQADFWQGLGETALNVGTGMASMAMAVPRLINNARDSNYTPSEKGALDDAFKQASEEYTYAPRTEKGQDYSEAVGSVINNVGIPMAGIGGSIVKGSSRLGRGGAAIPKEALVEAPKALPEASSKLDKLKALTEKGEWEDAPVGKGNTWMERQLDLGEKLSEKEQQFSDKRNIQGELDLRPAEKALDENGMPVDMARSLDAQEAGMDGQHDLFNEEHRAMSEQQRAQMLAEQQARERDIQVPQEDASIKQKQIEQAYADRQQQLFDEQRVNLKADRADELSQIQQMLLEGTPIPRSKLEGFGGRERGAIDLQAISEGLDKIKEKFKKFSVEVEPTKFKDQDSVMVRLKTPDGKMSGMVDFAVRPDGVLTAENAQVANGLRGHGAAQRMYLAAREAGYDIAPGRMQTELGDKMVKRLQENGLINKVRNSPGNGQRGAIDLSSPDPKPGNKVSSYIKDSPEILKARELLLADRKRELMNIDAYRTNIDTPEKVIALAPDAKDLGPTQAFKARTVSPGMNAVAISSNNPLLRYTRDAVSKTVRATEQYTRQWVTGPDGFGAKMKQLSKEEMNEVVGALQHADRKQRELSLENLQEAGFNSKQIDFIQHIQKMDETKLNLWNKVRTDLELPLVTKRMGHFAGNFSGDYKTLVYNKEGEVVGVIGSNTSWSNKMIQKKVLEKDPTLTFADTKRTALGGSGAKAVRFGGLEDLVGILAKDDPRFAKIQEIVDAAIKERGDSLYGASLHDKAKKGIWGNEGNKFWEDRDANTKQALKAFVDYWEDGIASHLNLPTEVKLKELMDNPALNHMPRAKQYVNDYINNFTGRNLGTLGDGINKILDAPFRYAGVGPSAPRAMITQFNKRASQMTMGFVNIPFMLTQYLQVAQMGLPELMKIRDSLGMNPVEFTAATGKAVSDGLKIAHEQLTGKKSNLDQFTRDSYEFAKDNGLLEFSEFTNARHIFQGKVSKGFDKVMDDLPVIGRTDTEAATRPYVFFAATNLLKDSGMSQKEIFETALNLTNHAMVNYGVSEKPLMYSKLGALGQSAGALQTFNHAFLGQMGTFAKEAAKGRPGPLAAATVAMLGLAGLKGVPFYESADELTKAISDKFFHKRQSISDLALKNSPQFMKDHPWTEDAVGSGALSAGTGINMQSRLSAANILPQADKGLMSAAGQAASPFGSYGVQVGKGLLDLATNRDALSAKNLAVTLAPSGTAKGLVENALKVNDKNQTINKRGEVDYQRTPFDTAIRKYSGATSLQESLNKEKLYTQQTNQRSRMDAQKAITEDAKRMIAQKTLTKEALQELAKKYVKESGDPQQLVNSLVQYAQEVNRTTKERLQGIPSNSISGVNKYKNYNE